MQDAIAGCGSCMPPAVFAHNDLATFLDTSDEWITTRTRMKERRISHMSATELATLAARRALACAGLDVDGMMNVTLTHDLAVRRRSYELLAHVMEPGGRGNEAAVQW